MTTEAIFPNGRLELPLLMERFKLRKSEHDPDALVGDCPVNHGAPSYFDAKITSEGWRLTFCEMGCLPREIWAASEPIDQRQPGEDTETAAVTPPKGLEQYALVTSVADLRADPPVREYALSVATTGNGVLARGQVGLLAARGGTGKSNALMQLGVSIATGTTWMGPGRGWSAKMGRALMLFAEEDEAEVRRRRFYALKAAGLISDEDLQLVVDNLVLMPMRGLGVALSGQLDRGVLPITQRATQIQDYLKREADAGRPFTMIGMDPLVRFAGADVEVDNHAATRFIEICETLSDKNCGGANVQLAHHSKKIVGKDTDPESADIVRGASGLVDAVRWAAIMVRKKGTLLTRLKVVKTNYAAEPEPLTLVKAEGCHGALEAVDADVEGVDEAPQADPRLQQLVYDEIVKEPSSGKELARRIHRNVELVLQACADLARCGKISRKGQKWIGSSGSGLVP